MQTTARQCHVLVLGSFCAGSHKFSLCPIIYPRLSWGLHVPRLDNLQGLHFAYTVHGYYPLSGYTQHMWLNGIVWINRIRKGKKKTVPPHLFWRRCHECPQFIGHLPYFLVLSLNLGDEEHKFPLWSHV